MVTAIDVTCPTMQKQPEQILQYWSEQILHQFIWPDVDQSKIITEFEETNAN